ncbi:Uma2 family endonuclease [Scytonema sp. NUACC26]|uniref:Uma2 family endonuclease n=1 Tax=Scytonema sp. NUACC26 TaxID=3140176 RepID=UPI0038B27648
MSPDTTTKKTETKWPIVEPYEVPTPPTNLIFDDGEPLESNRHRIAINVLIESAQAALAGREDFFVGGNMFVYYSSLQVLNRDFRGPDVFVVLDVDGTRDRQGWVVWEEEGRYPDMIIELLSPSTAHVDREEKKHLYERTFHTTNYFIFDPFDPQSLKGWQLDNKQRYQPLEIDGSGWLWCETLQLWLGIWEGQIRREPAKGTCYWLRLFDREKNLILLPEEIAEQEQQRAEQERQRGEQERQRAEQEQQRAEQEQQRAEQERQRAEQEQQRAEQEQQRAEQEQQRAERLAARLRELGEDPDAI